MTKEKLKQFIDLKHELIEIEERIKKEENIHLIHKLTERKNMITLLATEIMEYINTISDSRVRRIMQYKYIEGYTWKKIADIMHYDRSYPEKIISKYLNNS